MSEGYEGRERQLPGKPEPLPRQVFPYKQETNLVHKLLALSSCHLRATDGFTIKLYTVLEPGCNLHLHGKSAMSKGF